MLNKIYNLSILPQNYRKGELTDAGKSQQPSSNKTKNLPPEKPRSLWWSGILEEIVRHFSGLIVFGSGTLADFYFTFPAYQHYLLYFIDTVFVFRVVVLPVIFYIFRK